MLTSKQLEKTLEIAEKFYGTSSDPEQIPITKDSFVRLMSIHQEAIKLETDGDDNPISWVVVVPTSKENMELFLENKVNEKELFDKAVDEKSFEALYLCSAFTIPEYRGMGYAKKLLMDAINEFASEKSVELYAWVYSKEGESLIKALIKDLDREIKIRKS